MALVLFLIALRFVPVAGQCAGGATIPGTTTQQAIVDKHNEYRCSMCDTPPMTWDTTLAEQALLFMNTCPNGHCSGQDPSIGCVGNGENMYSGTAGDSTFQWEMAIGMWFAGEIDCYNFDTGGNTCVAGHMTQVAWVDSTTVGCASNPNAGSMKTLCMYQSPGNFNMPNPSKVKKCPTATQFSYYSGSCCNGDTSVCQMINGQNYCGWETADTSIGCPAGAGCSIHANCANAGGGSSGSGSGSVSGSSVASPTPAPGGSSGSSPTPAPGGGSGSSPTPAPGGGSGSSPTPAPGGGSGSSPTPAPGGSSGSSPTPAPAEGGGSGSEPAPAPAPAPPPVTFNLVVSNVNFDQLLDDAALEAAFKLSIKETIASMLSGILASHITCMLSQGSVNVDSVINPPVGVDSSAVTDTINADTASLQSDVASSLTSVSGISTVSTGVIGVVASQASVQGGAPAPSSDCPDSSKWLPACEQVGEGGAMAIFALILLCAFGVCGACIAAPLVMGQKRKTTKTDDDNNNQPTIVEEIVNKVVGEPVVSREESDHAGRCGFCLFGGTKKSNDFSV